MVEKDKRYTVDITGMNHEGQGVGRIDNFAVFVDGAIPGETADVIITKVSKSYAVARIIKIINASEDRKVPFCSAYDRCGGCSLQHMSYKAQLEFKTGVVREAVKRIGKLQNVMIHETIGMKNPMNYRNKAQYPVGEGESGPVIGFYASRSHEIIDGSSCGIQDMISDRIRKLVREFILKNGISMYDEKTGKGLVRHLMTRVGHSNGEMMVIIVINGRDLPSSQLLVEELVKAVPGIKSIYLNINMRNTNIILGDKNLKLHGSDSITDKIGGYRFEISPLSFFQVNPVQTKILYDKAVEYAGLTGSETVFDLYCGIGTIALFMSGGAGKVYGVEVVQEAVSDARRNAEINGVKNAEFIAGTAEEAVPRIYARGIRADVVVVDPPRKGCDDKLLDTLVQMQPKRIVYVSCNPSTLARDLGYLSERGFRTMEIQPVDMFPHTAHVECVVRIHRKDCL